MAWAEHIMLKNPAREDALAAVAKFYETNTDRKPLPASITLIARDMRLDRLARQDYEPPPSKALEDEVGAVFSEFVGGTVKHKTDRLRKAEAWLQTCQGKQESQAAIREFFAAKKEAQRHG
jgi:hypothetical protein